MKQVIIVLLLCASAFGSAATVWVSKAGAGTGTGVDQADAAAYSVLNTTNANGGCGSGANQVGPGTVVKLVSETDTFTAGATPITLNSACQGSSGNVIDFQAQLPLVWQAPYFSNTAAFLGSSNQYILIDGGGGNCGWVARASTQCTGWDIHNTANGSWLANQQNSDFIVCIGCVGIEIKGMYLHDVYDHEPPFVVQSCAGSGTTQTCQISGQPFTANNQYIFITGTSSGVCNHTTGASPSHITSFNSSQVVLTNTDGNSCVSSTGGYILEYNVGYPQAVSIEFGGNGAKIHNNTLWHNGLGVWANEQTASSGREIYNNDIQDTCAGMVEAGNVTSGTGLPAYWHDNHVYNFANWDTDVSSAGILVNGCHEDGIHQYGSPSQVAYDMYFYNNQCDGTIGYNMNSCFFHEDSGSSEWSGTNTSHFYWFNNICLTNTTKPCLEGGALIGAASNNALYANNTVICSDTLSTDIGYEASGSKVLWKNNASQGCGALIQWNSFTVATTSTDIQNNAYAQTATCSGNGCYNWGDQSISATTFSAWKTACSCDSSAVENGTGLGLNATTYVPTSTGALVYHAGANLYSTCNGQSVPGLGALCNDAAGNARPSSGGWDDGALSYITVPGSTILGGISILDGPVLK